ncbi:hypothetical protein EVAR_24930_1 [Eumeta japonica]|uniref:Gustatory receptor n=1 Tax=Eumeta variegata TaxID=151549 RepID=A0A4C1V8E3_EUMVA|nr:hypothetical protein EVAR_24930_1 [Eumeta japonica]
MGRPTKRAALRSHPYCKPLRSSIDNHIRLRQLLDHNDFTESTALVTISFLEVTQAALLTSLPGIIASVIESRVDHMKSTLISRLYLSDDPAEISVIENFLKFLELRPFKLRIWRLIPVDVSLPAGILSLGTTYLIVLVQLYHLFV